MLTIMLLYLLHRMLKAFQQRKDIGRRYQNRGYLCGSVIVLLLLFLLIFGTAEAQPAELVYDIVSGRSSIGTIVTTQHRVDDELRYRIDSKVSIPLLILRHRIEVQQTGTFKDDTLVSGLLVKKVNGKLKRRNEIVRSGDSYRITTQDDRGYDLRAGIDYSVAGLYFNEPADRAVIYSENFLQFVPVRTVSPGRYRISFPDGTVNHYTYENGICVLAEIKAGIGSATFELKSRSDAHASAELQ